MERLVAAALGLVLASAGAAKASRRPETGSRRPAGIRGSAWTVLGLAELALGLSLAVSGSTSVLALTMAFLVAATGYLALRLALLDREACNCWGVRAARRERPAGSASVRSALRPAWYFGRNGALAVATAAALGWSAEMTVITAGLLWSLLLAGTLVAVARLRLAVG